METWLSTKAQQYKKSLPLSTQADEDDLSSDTNTTDGEDN